MFRTRLISGIFLVLFALLFIITGGYVLWSVTLVLSLIGLFELYRVFGFEKDRLLGGMGYLFVCLYYILVLFAPEKFDWMCFVLFTLLAYLSVMVFRYPKYTFVQIAESFVGVYYVGVMLSFLYRTRMMERGLYLVWLIFLSSWICDTFAYCVGKLIGKHKMTPVLSPKKSVEGAIGGIVGTMLLTFLYTTLFADPMGIDQKTILLLSLISAVGAFLSMIGDLTASAIKRQFAIKDYGKLIPGHGGVMDRFDSVIFTAPIIYYRIDMAQKV